MVVVSVLILSACFVSSSFCFLFLGIEIFVSTFGWNLNREGTNHRLPMSRRHAWSVAYVILSTDRASMFENRMR